jgi:hypothetical protein
MVLNTEELGICATVDAIRMAWGLKCGVRQEAGALRP